MRPSILLLAAGIVAVGVACASATLVAQEPPREVPVDRADLDRDLEVMRRLLAREGLGAGVPVAVRAGEVKYVYSWGAADRSADAFHVRGDGALFLLRTSDAVAPAPGEPREEAAPEKAPTAWDEITAELEGRPRPGDRGIHDYVNRKLGARREYDAQKVEALRNRILEQLARFGDRIRGLGEGEHLTVVVSGGGSPVPDVAAVLGGRVLGNDGTTQVFVNPQTGAATSADRSVLTIRVRVADCRRAAKGEIDLDEFRRRAVVAAY